MDIILRKKIRDTYRKWMPVILSEKRISPYIFDFDIPLTPIEENVWTNIRCLGLPFFMQVPVGPYFIDFADPVKKIGIEVDGREWHKDFKKDEARERELNKKGWLIYRIPGYKTFKTREDFFPEGWDAEFIYSGMHERQVAYERRLKEFYSECSEGILTKIKKQNYDFCKGDLEKSELTPIGEILDKLFDRLIVKSRVKNA